MKTTTAIKTFLMGSLAAVIIAGCGSREDLKSTSDTDTTEAIVRPDQFLIDARITLYDGPVRTTDLFADSIEKFEDIDSSLAWNLKVHFFDSLGNEISYLEADSGVVREKTNFMEAYGNVVVRTEDSAYLYTEQLAYDVKTDSITTEEFVKIVQQGDTIQGYGLTADQRLKKTRIKRQVTGTLKSSKPVLD